MFDDITAALVLKQLSYDGYKDDGKIPHGYKFKVIYLIHFQPKHFQENLQAT